MAAFGHDAGRVVLDDDVDVRHEVLHDLQTGLGS